VYQPEAPSISSGSSGTAHAHSDFDTSIGHVDQLKGEYEETIPDRDLKIELECQC